MEAVRAIPILINEAMEDRLSWPASNSGLFSVCSAFNAITGTDERNNDWEWLWKIKCWEKVKTFLWATLKGRLFMHAEWKRRHLTKNSLCPKSREEDESIKHLLWDYMETKEVWRYTHYHSYFSFGQWVSPAEWIKDNCSRRLWIDGDAFWPLVFVFTFWNIWKNRNERVFSGTQGNNRRIAALAEQQAKEATSVMSKHRGLLTPSLTGCGGPSKPRMGQVKH